MAEIPLLENNQEMLLATLFQNMMHPKNHQRRESIDNKSYMPILSQEDAVNYLSKILGNNLKNEFSGRETAIRVRLQGAVSSEQAETFLSTPDKYYAAAVMILGDFVNGRGDIAQVVKMIISNGHEVEAVKEKLGLLLSGTYAG